MAIPEEIIRQLETRCIFEHYRLKDASLGLDSGAWEDTNPDDGLLPRKEDVNMDKDAIISHMNSSNRDGKEKRSIASHYGCSKIFKAPEWHYMDQPGFKQDKQKDTTISNNELFMMMSGGNNEGSKKLIEKLNPIEGKKYCMKFGCTLLQKRNGLCRKHYEKKRKNPSRSMTRHAYCNRFSFFSSVGMSLDEEAKMFLGPGEDSDMSFSSECGDFDDSISECHDMSESADGDDSYPCNIGVELEDGQEETFDAYLIESKCMTFSCDSPVFSKKIGLCKKHYYVNI